MKIRKQALAAVWIDHPDDDVSFQIRPFPFSKGVWSFDRDSAFADSMWAQFDYCCVDWKGISTDDGEDFPCNDENKRFVFDYIARYRNFVVEEANGLRLKLTEDLGN